MSLTQSLSQLTIQQQEFTLFPNLPVELRLKIWRFGRPDPQVIVVKYSDSLRRPSVKAPFINLLWVNRESREETQKVYRSLLVGESMDDRVHIDPELDTCLIALTACRSHCACLNILRGMRPAASPLLKHLAINAGIWINHSREELRPLLMFPSLERFTIVVITFPDLPRGTTSSKASDLLSWEERVPLDFKDIDNKLDVWPRHKRRDIVRQLREEAEQELAIFASHHCNWKLPKVDVQLMMKGGRLLRGLEEYFDDGDIPIDYDSDDSFDGYEGQVH